ncbi:hypothetical protein ABIA85_006656 [Bradyrhizobium sp. LA6.10]|uniref:hypothetical protein n=1 Tax=Bradyrhizobium sp. LA6.10 TaxID=3156318 RepID=UPI003396280A
MSLLVGYSRQQTVPPLALNLTARRDNLISKINVLQQRAAPRNRQRDWLRRRRTVLLLRIADVECA